MRGARAAPDRANIDPVAIRPILADTFIIEVDAEGAYPFRLSGTRINALWRNDLKGVSFFDLWRIEDRRSVNAALMNVIEGVSPVVGGARTRAPGDAELDLEVVLLPLRHFGKTHARVLGALSPAFRPDWIGQLDANPLEFVSMRVIEARGRPGPQPQGHGRPRPRLVVYECRKT